MIMVWDFIVDLLHCQYYGDKMGFSVDKKAVPWGRLRKIQSIRITHLYLSG